MVWILRPRKRAQLSATHPEAAIEYSRAQGPSGAVAAVLASALLGALLLVVSQFTTLYQVHLATSSSPIKTVATGSNHAYSLIPIALLAVVMAYAVLRQGSRPALVALGVLGVVALARRWIVRFARQRGGRSMSEKLAFEILDASQNTGGAVKRKEETHRMAESNKAFSHFRY